jgi:hypothetical protein
MVSVCPSELAKRFNVAPRTIRDILNGLTWKHVGEDTKGVERFRLRKRLSDDEVRQLRTLAKQTSTKAAAIAYGIPYISAWQIVIGKNRKNVI